MRKGILHLLQSACFLVVALESNAAFAGDALWSLQERSVPVSKEAIGSTIPGPEENTSLTVFELQKKNRALSKGYKAAHILSTARTEHFDSRLMNASAVAALSSDNQRWFLIWLELPSARTNGKPVLFRISEARRIYGKLLLQASPSYMCTDKALLKTLEPVMHFL